MSDLSIGKFKLTKSNNLNGFLEALGFDQTKRKLAASTSPEVEITKSGEKYRVKTTSALNTSEFEFRPGEQFDENRHDGVKVKSLITVDGNKWTQIQTPLGGDKVVTAVRKFEPDGMSLTASVGDISDERYYTRQ